MQGNDVSMVEVFTHKVSKSSESNFQPRNAKKISEPPSTPWKDASFLLYRHNKYVMAAHPAAKAISTQDITDKARRELLQLLEAVCQNKRLVQIGTDE